MPPRDLFAETGVDPGIAPAAVTGPRDLFQEAGVSPSGYTPPVFASMGALTPAAMTNIQGSSGAIQPLNSAAAGVASTGVGTAQLLTRGGTAVTPQGSIHDWFQNMADKAENARRMTEFAYQTGSPDLSQMTFDPFRAAGNAASMAPLAALGTPAAGAGWLAKLGLGAASGAGMGAAQPIDADQTPDYWQQKKQQVMGNAAVGAAAPLIGEAIAKTVGSKVSDAAQKLMDAGVTPTPGQLMGGRAAVTEQKFESLPGIGGSIAKARQTAMDQFNRASINQALQPIGESLDMKTPLGREAIDEMATKAGAAYDKILPGAVVQANQPFLNKTTQLVQMAQSGLPPAQAQQFSNIVKTKLIDQFSPGGGMTGEAWKAADSELGRLATGYHASADFDQRQLGDSLQQMQGNLRDLLRDSNPQLAPQIDAANQTWALSRRVMLASTKGGEEPGVFGPGQLQQVVRQLDPTRNKTAFARGNATMQDWAEAAKSVLGSKYPDSGTSGRSALWQIPAALGGMAAIPEYGPMLAAGAGAGMGTGMAAYSPLGRSLFAAMMRGSPAAAQAARSGAPYLAALAPSIMGRLAGP